MKNKMKRGFTILELTLTIIIVSIIVVSVIAGQKILEQSKLKKIVSEYQNIDSASATFFSKYGKLAGDLNIATQYFSSSYTMDGNANNILDTDVERFTFWQHISLAGLIKGAYNPMPYIDSGNISDYNPDNMFPLSHSGGYFVPAYFFEGVFSKKNVIALARIEIESNSSLAIIEGVLKHDLIYSLDYKLDDGKPLSGNLRNYSDDLLFQYPCHLPSDNNYYLEQSLTEQDYNCVPLLGLSI
jgi:prepilin-type N-terminal cleavage/methylation domain-containing protein